MTSFKFLMQNSYSFLLKNPGLRQYNRIAYIITLLNFLYFCWVAFFSQINNHWLAKLFVVLTTASFAFEWLYKKLSPGKQYFFAGNYLLMAAGYLFISSNYLLVFLHLLLAAADTIARQDIYLRITKDGITQSQWKLKKVFEWSSIQNVILKDALLTLDFKNDKIHQYDINEAVNEDEFNSFCKSCLSLA